MRVLSKTKPVAMWGGAAMLMAIVVLLPLVTYGGYSEGGYYDYGQGYYYGYAQGYYYGQAYYYGYGQGYYAPANSWQTTAAACGASGQFQTSAGTCSLAARTQKCR